MHLILNAPFLVAVAATAAAAACVSMEVAVCLNANSCEINGIV